MEGCDGSAEVRGTQVPVDVKGTSKVQCGSRRLQFMFNSHAGSRVQLEGTQESSSRAATDAAGSKLAATRDRAQIYRWTSLSNEMRS